jgi:putative aldouronate transport system permease protein
MIIRNGYSLFPEKISFKAYEYLWMNIAVIGRGYLITLFVTAVGTVAGLLISSMCAYALSKKDFPLRKIFTFMVFFTMIFNGGLVPFYLLYAKYLGISNTILALIIPGLLVNAFNIIIMKSYFSQNIPDAIIESGTLDGAGTFMIFFKIVIPISYPIFATVGLLIGVGYWNDWYNGLIFLTDTRFYNIQNILNRLLMDIQYLQSTNVGGELSATMQQNMPSEAIRMAIAVFIVVPILIIYAFFQKYFIKGITVGAVKG